MQQTVSGPSGSDLEPPLPPAQQAHARRFGAAIRGYRTAAVAFSGGVDSSVVLALTIRVLGRCNVTAVLGVSPSLAQAERAGAHRVAERIGARLVEIETREMEDPNYLANGPDRCFFCKHELYSRTTVEVLDAVGADVLFNGDTADDAVRHDRPGRRAADELGVRSPLVDAGLGKRDVRALARALYLPVWNKPSSPCLASRIPRATPVTITRLNDVERAEMALKRLGLQQLRVRHGGNSARVELGPDEHARLSDSSLRAAAVEAVETAGFTAVEIADHPLRRD
jgi:uncharacterized protein